MLGNALDLDIWDLQHNGKAKKKKDKQTDTFDTRQNYKTDIFFYGRLLWKGFLVEHSTLMN